MAFITWSALWTLFIVAPPGSQAFYTLYRLNLVHGVLCSLAAVFCLLGFLNESWTTTATLSYFIVDFINMIVNDFIFRAPSYQPPTARKLEYFHHILCCTVGVMSEFLYKDFCTFEKNPFVNLMFAEVSTPLLMVWRITTNDTYLIFFAVTFFIFRIVYHGLFFIPACISSCHYSVGYGFGVPYNVMNVYFFYQIVNKILSNLKKSKGK